MKKYINVNTKEEVQAEQIVYEEDKQFDIDGTFNQMTPNDIRVCINYGDTIKIADNNDYVVTYDTGKQVFLSEQAFNDQFIEN